MRLSGPFKIGKIGELKKKFEKNLVEFGIVVLPALVRRMRKELYIVRIWLKSEFSSMHDSCYVLLHSLTKESRTKQSTWSLFFFRALDCTARFSSIRHQIMRISVTFFPPSEMRQSSIMHSTVDVGLLSK